MGQLDRNILIIGEEGQGKLSNAKVLVFGVGGVGGYVCEALARAGIGTIDIVDGDTVDETNLNRQIIATYETVGKVKVDVMKARMESINRNLKCHGYYLFYLPENKGDIDFSNYDYIVDAVDTVTAKLQIIEEAKRVGTKVISSMGTGNKTNATLFQITDISKTSVCPLAKVMRKELRNRCIEDVKVLYSKEEPVKHGQGTTPGSLSYVPAVAGLLIGGEIIKDILEK